MNETKAYPLHWPQGWKRTPPAQRKKSAAFKVTEAAAIEDLFTELDRLGAREIVLSSNLTLSTFGRPYVKQRQPEDPGIAVYFSLKGKQMVMARDAFADWRDNIRSLGLAVEAFRALHRHGGADMMERAFTGFAALEHNPAGATWYEILQVEPDEDPEVIERAYLKRRSETHPDRGGNAQEFQAVQDAYKSACSLREMSGGH